jgi:hypothetical protein
MASTSRFFLPQASVRTLTWFSAVRNLPSSLTDVRCRAPEAINSRISGYRSAYRAAVLRLYASSSASPRPARAYSKSDP